MKKSEQYCVTLYNGLYVFNSGLMTFKKAAKEAMASFDGIVYRVNTNNVLQVVCIVRK